MKQALAAVVVLACAGLACRGGGPEAVPAAEAPPPLIEPTIGPGSTLVDARADELVRAMSDRLARATAFTIVAEEIYDEVP